MRSIGKEHETDRTIADPTANPAKNLVGSHEAYDRYVSTHFASIHKQGPAAAESDRRVWRDYLGSLLPADRSAHIADVGCGSGSFLYFLKREGYVNICGVDRSPEQINLAKRHGIEGAMQDDAVNFLSSNLAAFDCVVSVDVLEHMERRETLALLHAMYFALRPGGRLILRTANGSGPFAGHMRYSDFTHVQTFTVSSISQVLRLTNFDRIEVLPEGPRVHGPISAVRWILWQAINAALRIYLAVETGQIQARIFTQNLIAVAYRPSGG
ncbi:MAG: class I SAM-dependent methyltransferase [Candidatus Acidiferrales bacterium]